MSEARMATVLALYHIKVEHRDSKKKMKKANKFILHSLILWNVFFKMTHVLPLIPAQNCDNNALQNRRGRPVLNKFGLSFRQHLRMYSIVAAQYIQKY